MLLILIELKSCLFIKFFHLRISLTSHIKESKICEQKTIHFISQSKLYNLDYNIWNINY
jgi:hypothetical protein